MLKIYFKNKISTLYLKKEIIDIVIKSDTKNNQKNELIYSQIEESLKELNMGQKPEKTQIFKEKVENLMMGKFNEKIKKKSFDKHEYSGKLMKFKLNDHIIKDHLNSQKNLLDSKLLIRKQNSIIKSILKRSGSIEN